ncbi:uncharacterized protein LOC135072009 [Ostrinia nubilalis]|uniref:uncharacterized protein LOC135072009 n=1 Tax=Ostrinia nubilalis TaxID=29057 RepID=UPI0030825E95
MCADKTSRVISVDVNGVLPSHLNYGAFILEQISNLNEKIAFINGATDEQISFGEIEQQIVNISSSLTKLGVKPGDVVAICSENRPEFLISAIAALCSGAVITFINSAYNRDELKHTMNISKPKYFFMSPSTLKTYYEVVRKCRPNCKYFVFGDIDKSIGTSYGELARVYIDRRTFQPVDYKGRVETALILYSSGTTGPPKGAKVTHSGLIIAGMQPTCSKRDLTFLSIAPWSNTVGYINTIRETIRGRTCVYLNKFNEATYLGAVEKHKAGLLMAVPPLVVMLAKSSILKEYDVSSVELVYSGGAPLDWNVIMEMKQRFPNLKHVLQGYGMTETTGVLTEEHEGVTQNGSVGRVAPGNTVKIVDIETRKILGPNEQGEVCVKGPVLFAGYIGKDMSEYFDEDGYYRTGDVAYYDDEGFFFITDRLKELIKYKAWQVAPSELEAVILQHPKVKDVGVIGTPDQLAGELPTAFVVKKSEELTEKEVIDFVASKVSPWKYLRGGVRFIEEVPKNGSGKILRRLLRDLLKKNIQSKL